MMELLGHEVAEPWGDEQIMVTNVLLVVECMNSDGIPQLFLTHTAMPTWVAVGMLTGVLDQARKEHTEGWEMDD